MARIRPRRSGMYIGLLAYTLAYWFSREMAKPSIAILLADGSISSSAIGLLLSVQNLLPLIMAIPLAALGDVWGHKRVLNLGSGFSGIGALIFIASSVGLQSGMQIGLVTVGQIFTGVAWTISWISLQSLMADNEAQEKAHTRGQTSVGISRMILIMSIGMVLGPLFSGFLIHGVGIGAVWLLNAVLCAFQLFLSVSMSRMPTPGMQPGNAEAGVSIEDGGPEAANPDVSSAKHIFRDLGGLAYAVMVVFSFIMMFASEVRSGFLPVVLRERGIDSRVIGYISSVGSLATCAVRIAMNIRGPEKLRPGAIIYSSMALGFAAFLLLAVIPPGYGYIVPSILIGLFGGMVEPIIIDLILKNCHARRRGTALTGRVLANRIAMFLAPSISGVTTAVAGIAAGFGLIACGVGLVMATSLGVFAFKIHRSTT